MTRPHDSGAAAGDPQLATLVRLLGVDDAAADFPLVALPWASSGAGAGELLRHTVRRNGARVTAGLSAVRARRRLTTVRPRRGSLTPGLRDAVRRGAGSGYVARVRPEREPTLLDLLLADAGATPIADLGVGADGAVRVLVGRDGGRGLLRMGLAGSPADPSEAAEALRVLAGRRTPHVPVLLADGARAGVRWSLESAVPGRRPWTVPAPLADQVAAFVAALPAGPGHVDLEPDVATVTAAAPAEAAGVRALVTGLQASPLTGQATLRHGDLWSGNLLADGDTLCGVVDWDAWSPAGLPAVDLLHLLGTDQRLRTRSSLGEVWVRRPWEAAAFVALARRYWPEWGDDPAARAAVGTGWWLGQLAADLRRSPRLAADATWVHRNISVVVAAAG